MPSPAGGQNPGENGHRPTPPTTLLAARRPSRGGARMSRARNRALRSLPVRASRPAGPRRATEVEVYLARFPRDLREALARLRRALREAAPDAEEGMSYRMLSFRLDGRILAWYAGFRDHGSLFVGGLARFPGLADQLRPYASGRGTLRFTPEHPLPSGLVRRLVRARRAEIVGPRGGDRRARRRGIGAAGPTPRARGDARSRRGRGRSRTSPTAPSRARGRRRHRLP